ncbi:hypothetical protein K2173_006144 [Erythroxylum novogranatense]|uniref:RING-type E3 ubiquitin transferase n=1 Tax=Erythroxylum novogranatense TaxID=1862640 RepID=A0AAV8TDY1_9ROSI|nr:hypothetical protein K2173_006144 [Erythroxylum novogranatense]
MEGQVNGSSNYLKESDLGDGSNGINLQVEQNSTVPGDAQVHDGHPAMDSLEIVSPQTLSQFQDLSTPHVGAGINRTLEIRRPSNLNLINGQPSNEPSDVPRASSSTQHCNIDLNVAFDGNDQDMETSFGLYRGRPDAPQNGSPCVPTANSGMIPSGIRGSLLEAKNNGEGPSDSTYVSCKRKLAEPSGEILLDDNLRSPQLYGDAQQDTTTILDTLSSLDDHQSASNPEQSSAEFVGSGEVVTILHQASDSDNLGHGPRDGVGPGSHQISIVAGETGNYQRNIRLRRAPNGPENFPTNLPAWITRNNNMQLPALPTALSFDCVLSTGSSSGIVRPSTSINPHTLLSNSVRGGDAVPTDVNARNNPGYDMVVTDFQRGNLEHVPDGSNFPGNIASGFPGGSSAHFHHHQPSVPNRIPYASMPEELVQRISPTWNRLPSIAGQFQQRILGLANRVGARVQSHHCPIYSGSSPAAGEMEPSGRVGDLRSSMLPFRSGITMLAERQTGNLTDLGLQFSNAAQRRSRLVSEVRNALAIVRRGDALQLEDVMLIDRSVLYRVPEEEPDNYQEMRLDVDSMSYEELVDLQDQIGYVSTGLSEITILTHLSHQEYQSNGSFKEEEPCSICQEEFADGDNASKLACGHPFHFDCIKQWLVQKNACPICKVTALNV